MNQIQRTGLVLLLVALAIVSGLIGHYGLYGEVPWGANGVSGILGGLGAFVFVWGRP